MCCLALFLCEPTSPSRTSRPEVVPSQGSGSQGVQNRRGRGDQKEGRKEGAQNGARPPHKAAPLSWRSSLRLQKAPTPSRSSTFTKEDHGAQVARLGCLQLLYYPPDLEYPSCYHDEKGQYGSRASSFPQWWWAALPKWGLQTSCMNSSGKAVCNADSQVPPAEADKNQKP